MNTKRLARLLILVVLLFHSACASLRPKVPVGVVPAAAPWSAEVRQQTLQMIGAMAQKNPLANDLKYTTRVQNIIGRLFAALQSSEQWHVFILRTKEWNAFCAAGNVMAIYTGLLDDLHDDDEVAAVVGHELAHDLARHMEDPTKGILAELTKTVAIEVAKNTYRKTGSLEEAKQDAQGIALLGQGLLISPYSRDQESEADQIGLFLMADAGFNPEKAPNIWYRMSKSKPSDPVQDFFNDHPPTPQRAEALMKILPLAKQRFLAHAHDSKLKPTVIALHQNEIMRDNRPLNPGRLADNLTVQGEQLINAYQFDHAEASFQKALRAEPNHYHALNGLGILQMKKGDPEVALKTFQKMKKVAPYNGTAHYNLACTHSILGDIEQASEELRKAVEIQPALKQLAMNDGDLLALRASPLFKETVKNATGGASFSINVFQ